MKKVIVITFVAVLAMVSGMIFGFYCGERQYAVTNTVVTNLDTHEKFKIKYDASAGELEMIRVNDERTNSYKAEIVED